MSPLRDEFKIRDLLGGTRHTHGSPLAGDRALFPRPSVRIAVHHDEVGFAQRPPSQARSVDHRLRQTNRLLLSLQPTCGEEEYGESATNMTDETSSHARAFQEGARGFRHG